MKLFSNITLAILVFLAVSSGIAKVMLVEQDVVFFGKYGFAPPFLIGFGIAQIVGGVFLVFQKTRFIGGAIVAITFLLSAVLLVMDKNIPIAIVTTVALIALGFHMKQSLASNQSATS